MCYDRFGLRRWLFATVALCACSSKARIEIHVEHDGSLDERTIDSIDVTASIHGGTQMGNVSIQQAAVTTFFNNCTTDIVNVVVGDRAPADIDLTVTANRSGASPVTVQAQMIHVDSGQVTPFYARLGGMTDLKPPNCEPSGSGGMGGTGGVSGTGGISGTGGSSGTGGTGGGDLGAPCNSSADCNSTFSTCLKTVLPATFGLNFPGGYCTKACPPGNDCGPNGTWGEWTDSQNNTECWCQRTCNTATDCHRTDFAYTCCRTSPLPDGGAAPAGACNPPAVFDPQYCN
jgi:hypothetical protein